MNTIWNTCLDLALEGLFAGSLAIAAVITDSEGNIISKGRNQLFDSEDSCSQIKNTVISHAEMNALANLPHQYRKVKDLILYTTVEPCPMCMGAIAMSRIRKVGIASRDPYASGTCLVKANHFFAVKTFDFRFESGEVEKIFTILHLTSLFLNNQNITPDHPFVKDMGEICPDYLRIARLLASNQYFLSFVKQRDKNRMTEMVADIWAAG